jgi:hypothetical protein
MAVFAEQVAEEGIRLTVMGEPVRIASERANLSEAVMSSRMLSVRNRRMVEVKLGKAIAANMPNIAIATIISIKVKPC